MTDLAAVEQFVSLLGQAEPVPPPQGTPPRTGARTTQPLTATLVAALMLVLAVGTTAFVIWKFDSVQMANRSAAQVSASVQNLKSDFLDAETGQRGFLLTGKPEFLEPFEAGAASVKSTLPKLRQVLLAQPPQLARLALIEMLWADKLDVLQKGIDFMRSGQKADALALVAEGRGKALMDAMRVELDAISDGSELDMENSQREFEFWRGLLLKFGALALIIAILVSYWYILRTRNLVALLGRQRAQLVDANGELAATVDLRTQHMHKISALLQSLTSATTEAIYAKDRDSRMVFANEACLQVIGLDSARVLGRKDSDYHDLAEAEVIMRIDQRIMASGIGESIEETYSSPDGPRIFLSNKAPLRGKSGEVIGIVGISTDITGRKADENRLHLSEQRFRAAVAAVGGIVWTNNAKGEMRGEQPGWAALTGQSLTEYQSYGWSQAVHPDDIGPTIASWNTAVAEKRPFACEHRLLCADGRWRIFSVRSIPVLDKDQMIQEWVGVHTDVTAEREAQRRLKETLDWLGIALEAANTGAWEYDASSQNFILDARASEIRDLAPDSPKTVASLVKSVHPDDKALFLNAFEGLDNVKDEERLEVEYRISSRDGEERWVACRGKALVKPGQPVRMIGTVRDATARKRQEERIKFLMKELSHRAKNSLAIVQAIARQTSAKASNLEHFSRSFHGRLNGMAQSLNLLVDHDWNEIPIRDVINSQLDHFVDAAQNRIVLDGPELWLKPEAAQNIGLALHELSTNAAKYGALSVDTGKVAIAWTVSSADGGDETFEMHWRESGGPAVSEPDSRGFGHSVIHRVVKAALSGSSGLQFPVDGVRWDLAIPATHVVRSARA